MDDKVPSRSLLAWMPFLWKSVLFPGRQVGATQFRWLSLLLLLACPGLLLYPCQTFHLLEPDEGRYAEIPREMLERGEWIVPYLQGEPYLDKPPLLYWLTIISYRLFGVHEWSARLAPALAVHGCVLLVYLLGRRSLGERAAFWGALLLGVAPAFLGMGRLLVLDGVLTFWVTLALLAGFEAVRGQRLRWAWWLLAATACGLGVLTKGPVAVLLFLPPLVAHAWLTGARQHLVWRAYLALAALVLAIALPWYIAIVIREPQFGLYFFWQHNLQRYFSPFDHLEPFWYYGPILLGGLLPGTLLLPGFARFLVTGDRAQADCRTPELGYYLLAGGWCVLFFSLSGSKLPTYVLPAFPPLALALGGYLASRTWARTIGPALVGPAIVLVALGCYCVLPWYADYRSPMGQPEIILRHCADADTAVVCYPRHCDSVAFYLERDDLQCFRSKQTPELIEFLKSRPRTVVLLSHRSSLATLKRVLPPELQLTAEVSFRKEAKGLDRIAGDTPWGLCDLAVVERRAGP